MEEALRFAQTAIPGRARLSIVRVFAAWLQGIDPRTEVPPSGLISSKQRRTRPYIYTDDQIADIVTEASGFPRPMACADGLVRRCSG